MELLLKILHRKTKYIKQCKTTSLYSRLDLGLHCTNNLLCKIVYKILKKSFYCKKIKFLDIQLLCTITNTVQYLTFKFNVTILRSCKPMTLLVRKPLLKLRFTRGWLSIFLLSHLHPHTALITHTWNCTHIMKLDTGHPFLHYQVKIPS